MTRPELPLVAPLLLGPANALAVVGAPWRWVRDTARELGVPTIGAGKKRFVPAAAFVAALEAAGKTQCVDDAAEPETLDPAEAVRRALGRQRRTSSPARSSLSAADTAGSEPPLPHASPHRPPRSTP